MWAAGLQAADPGRLAMRQRPNAVCNAAPVGPADTAPVKRRRGRPPSQKSASNDGGSGSGSDHSAEQPGGARLPVSHSSPRSADASDARSMHDSLDASDTSKTLAGGAAQHRQHPSKSLQRHRPEGAAQRFMRSVYREQQLGEMQLQAEFAPDHHQRSTPLLASAEREQPEPGTRQKREPAAPSHVQHTVAEQPKRQHAARQPSLIRQKAAAAAEADESAEVTAVAAALAGVSSPHCGAADERSLLPIISAALRPVQRIFAAPKAAAMRPCWWILSQVEPSAIEAARRRGRRRRSNSSWGRTPLPHALMR